MIFSCQKNNEGSLLVQVLVFASISTVLLTGLIGWAGANIKASRSAFYREQAFQIAEAGIEYYRWHLAHAPLDFQDGTGVPGPYVHQFNDKDGNRIGQFTLDITPPPANSTMVVVRSKGEVDAMPGVYRRVETVFAKESYAKFAWLLNSSVTFGGTSEVFGPIHSNTGIRFDGTAHNIITSGVASYNDPSHNGAVEFGVHTHRGTPPPNPNTNVIAGFRSSEAPPTSPVPDRSDVFLAGREFPVPTVDFNGLTQNLQTLKTKAQSDGFYRGSSGVLGYRILIKANGTFDLYKVYSVMTVGSGCINSAKQGGVLPSGWGTWSVAQTAGSELLVGNYAIPSNGIIFLEDHIWVSGNLTNTRLTIASGRFPANSSNYTNIIVNQSIRYSAHDGSSALALMAQGNIFVGLLSDNDLKIDGALVAQNGMVGRYDYPSNSCGTERHRALLTTHGMIATNKPSAFCYDSNGVTCNSSGYDNRAYNYDNFLLYSPPPEFPLTSDYYSTVTWKEIK